MDEIRILIADDHEVVRRGLVLVLNLEKGFQVVGEAHDGAQAVAETAHLHPDVVILDMKMPGMDGRTAASQIKQNQPNVRVMMLSGAEIDDNVFDTLDAGVDGYVPKDISPDELSHAIRTVAAGRSYIHADVTRALLDRVRQPARKRGEIHLTPREMDVLGLLATSATYRDIAKKLHIGEETVRSHAKSVLSKLDQPNRTLAVVTALKLGIITLEGADV